MKRIEIPRDRDLVANLALSVVGKNPTAAKDTGVKPPANMLKTLRTSGKKASRLIAQIEKHEKIAKDLGKQLAPELAALQETLQDLAQVLKRQLSDEKLIERWGFSMKESSGGTNPPKSLS
jgi:hypothetical protein